ncbi:glycosyltransferase family 4 protein [Pseudomonas oryzihabitans]|uniref:glycosyltransferase family 4 protein n=1 Tax=Pseudomonas oryzihabitans TaxID=47885 RepID=UPI0012386799|nr:glycosyltransferase family 1 protein [Pseudomonas oryzihabitans]QEU05643.1 glycosyltransferase family 4 protein [Pseudomonas oryzihabitans]
MKLLFNAVSLYPPKTGIGYYSENLIRELRLLDDQLELVGWLKDRLYSCEEMLSLTAEGDMEVISGARTKKMAGKIAKNFSNFPFLSGAMARLNYIRTYAPSKKILEECSKEGFLYHETNFVVAPYNGDKVVTVHDLSHERFPEHQKLETLAILKQRLKKSLQQVRHIVADSQFTKQEIIELYDINPEKISVVLLGVSSAFVPLKEEDVEATLRKIGLHFKHYILSVCTLQPRKNLLRLVTAYSRLPSSVRRSMPLVLTGIPGWKNTELLDVIGPMVDSKEVYLMGYIPQEVLVKLYAGAAIFAYPSLYEGFGLPVLEAMASGTPVLTANNSSIPEVAAGAAIEVDPYSTDDILLGLDRLITDTELRSSLVERGMERANFLTWRRTAQETLAIYNRVSE